jgi:hypothetical protein
MIDFRAIALAMHETAGAELRGDSSLHSSAYGEVKKIQACLRRNRTTTSMRAIS